MRGIERGETGGRRPAVFIAVLVLLCSSCKQWAQVTQAVSPESGASRPEVLEGGEITLVNTRFDGPPRELYTSGDRFLLAFSFDPTMVDLARLRSCGLWSQDRPGGPWRRLGTFPAKRAPASTQFVPPAEGAYGLRTSAIYRDGKEVLVPGPADRPLVWLYVDRTPPRLLWISPAMRTPIAAGNRLDLQWGASEMRFGEAPSVVEWSADGGASWGLIDRVKPGRGTGKVSWKVPPAACRPGARPLVRITAWDLVGNRASALLVLTAGPSLQGDRGQAAGVAAAAQPENLTAQDAAAPQIELASAAIEEPSGPRAEPPESATEVRSVPQPVEERPAVAAREEGAAPGIILRNFKDGSVHPGGGGRYIFFSTSGVDPARTRVSIEWRAAAEEPFEAIAAAVPARDGKYLWKIPPVTIAAGTLRLSAFEPAAGGGEPRVLATCEATVAIDSQPPMAGIRGIQRGPAGEPQVALDVFDQGPAGLKEVRLFITADGGATWRDVPVPDPARPVPVALAGTKMGFWVAATDRAGNSTPIPEAGSVPQQTFEGQAPVTLAVEDLADEVIRGGDQRYCLWRFAGPEDLKALVEVSLDGGGSWSPVGEAPAQAGKSLWIAPAENSTAILRVRVRLADGSVVEGRARPVRIDAAPPQLEAGRIPGRVASDLKFPLQVTDPGGSGVESVVAFVRPAAGQPAPAAWQARPAARVALDPAAGQIAISVADLPEGAYDLFLAARDRVGNGATAPAPSSAPVASFEIDRTPVAIRAVPTAGPWVEGLTAAVQVDLDLADAVAPLWLEERAGGSWTEVVRWETLTPGEDLYRFPVPVGKDKYEVRFGIRDAVGNVSYAPVGIRTVERAIRLAPSLTGEAIKSGSNVPIAWSIHPALNEVAPELKVVVSHQPKEGADWIQLYDDLRASSSCVFTAPPADGEQHRLKVSLFHRGKLLGEDGAGPLSITGGPTAPSRIEPQVVPIGEDSLYYSDRGEIQWEKFRSARAQYQKWFAEVTAGLRRDAQGAVLSAELEKLAPDVRRTLANRDRELVEAAQKIRENFQKALERDPRNYRASYGMAQLLHKTSPGEADQAIKYLVQTVEIKADHAAALNDLGVSYILRGDYPSAEDPLRRALAVEDQGSYHYNLAICLFHQRNTAEARLHFERAIEKGGSSLKLGEVYYYLVAAFLEEGQTEEARRRFGLYRDQIPAALRDSLAMALKAKG
jgi:TolA-binding protein